MEVELQAIPNAADLAHQLLVTSLGAGGEDIDVFVLDVVWAAEFARAGWLADLSDAFPPARVREEFLAGPAAAASRAAGPSRCPGTWTWGSSTTGPISSRSRRARTQRSRRRSRAAQAGATRDLRATCGRGGSTRGSPATSSRRCGGTAARRSTGDRLLLDTPAARAALGWLRELVAERALDRGPW